MSISSSKKNARLLIGSGENCADIRYATGISTPDDFIWFSTVGLNCALLSSLEIDRARANKPDYLDILPERDFGTSRVDIIFNIAKKFRFPGFTVPENFPLGLADALRSRGIIIETAAGSFFPERISKRPDETAAITAAQRAGEAGFARAVELLRASDIAADGRLFLDSKPLTSEILRAEIDCAILRAGMLPTGTICAGGVQSSQPHNAGSGQLFASTPIVIDIFPRSSETGYWGDLTRTVVRGTAPDVVKRAYDAVLETREKAKSSVAIGAKVADLHRAAAKNLKAHGFPTGTRDGVNFGFFHGLGHGVGLEIHEAPRVSHRSEEVLHGGEVITIEPGVYYPEWGGIRLEDLISLTPSGEAVCLTEAPDFLEI